VVRRVVRVLRHRLPIILAAVVLATAGAAWFTGYLNAQVRPRFEATAVAHLQETDQSSEPGRTATAAQPSLSTAVDVAVDANAGFLDADHGVRGAPSTQSLEFSTVAETPEIATSEAADMRNRYLLATAPPPIEERMRAVLGKAALVREQLAELIPPEVDTPVDLEVSIKQALLNSQINLLNSEIAKLSVEQVQADTESEKAAIQEDIAEALAVLINLRTELEALPGDSAEGPGRGDSLNTGEETTGRTDSPSIAASDAALEDQFRIESLQLLYSSLQQEFQDLYITSIDGEPETLPEIEVVDRTRDPMPVTMGAGIGLLAALLIVLGSILLVDRLRPGWWTDRDLRGVFAETPDGPVWEGARYGNSTDLRRMRAVQSIAVGVLSQVESGPSAIGLVGVGTRPSAVRDLAVDLAESIVTTGRPTFVIDAVGLDGMEERQSGLVASSGPTLGDLLNPWQQDNADDLIEKAVDEAIQLRPGLSLLPSGGPSLYSVEGAMTPVVARLLAVGRERYPLTVVPMIDMGTAFCDALARKLDAMVIVGQAGSTKIAQVERLREKLEGAGTPVLGTVLIVRGPRRRLRDRFGRLLGRIRGDRPAPSGTTEYPRDRGVQLYANETSDRQATKGPRRRARRRANRVLQWGGSLDRARHASDPDKTAER
jgi:hypothetical protein